MSVPGLPSGVRRVREGPASGDDGVPLYVHPEWAEALPWLVQGTTGTGTDRQFDLGLFGDAPVGPVLERWRALREVTGMDRAVHALQVHGRRVLEHAEGSPGVLVTEGADGHATSRPGILVAVALADCVPISLVDPERRRIVLLHGGWRGTAAGIVEEGLAQLGGDVRSVLAHMGPAICGDCYEVGPEVHEALGLAVPDGNTPVDVRAVQAGQLVSAGVRAERVTVSEHCTRCGSGFFSHRGGSKGRQMGVLGIR